jgi:hypothetical protein
MKKEGIETWKNSLQSGITGISTAGVGNHAIRVVPLKTKLYNLHVVTDMDSLIFIHCTCFHGPGLASIFPPETAAIGDIRNMARHNPAMSIPNIIYRFIFLSSGGDIPHRTF